jgi:hypothetical protein
MAQAMRQGLSKDALMTYHPDSDPFSSSSKFFHADK